MNIIQKYLSNRKAHSKILSTDLKSFQNLQKVIKPHTKLRLNFLSPKRINNEAIKDSKSIREENIKLIKNLISFRKLFFEQAIKNSQAIKKLKSLSEENEELSLEMKKLNKNFDLNNKVLFPLQSSFELPNKKIKQIKSADNIYSENLLLIKNKNHENYFLKNYENYFLKNSENMNRNLKSLHLLDIMQIEILPGKNNIKEERKALSQENNSIEKEFKRLIKIYPMKYIKRLNLENFYSMSNLQQIEDIQKDIKNTKTTLSSMEEFNDNAFLPSSNVNSRITSGTYSTSTRVHSPFVYRTSSKYLCENKKSENKKILKKPLGIKFLPPINNKKFTLFVKNSENLGMDMEKIKNVNFNRRRSLDFRQRNKSVELKNLYEKVSKARDCLDFYEDINNYYGSSKLTPTFKLKKEIKRMDLLYDKVKNLGKKLRDFDILEKNCDIREDKFKKKQIQDYKNNIKIQIFDMEDNIIKMAAKVNTKI